jgi:AcrR family transcriptional regulator
VTEGRTRNRRGRPSTPLLSKSKILAAGLELVDENGLADFSVQTVADKLGVTGASIYHYFSDRDQLLRGLGLLVLREMRDLHRTTSRGETPRPWQDWVRDYADALYTASSRHPNVVPILLARRTHGDVADLFEIALDDLVRGGLDSRLALLALDSVEGLVLAWISFEQAREPNWGYGELAPEDFPGLSGVLGRGEASRDRLSTAVDAIVAGYAQLAAGT